MSSKFDPADFVDDDFQARKTAHSASTTGVVALRAPSRDEVDSKVVEAQQKLAELKRAQEDLERERASLEETRRRQMEFQTGRQEMVQNLTRGLGLLEEAEFAARRDAEQMTRALDDFREALAKLEAVHEETWTKDNFNIELTRALTAIENARMEWNGARLKFPILSGQKKEHNSENGAAPAPVPSPLHERSFGQLCKMGLAFTWPLAVIGLVALGVFIAISFPR